MKSLILKFFIMGILSVCLSVIINGQAKKDRVKTNEPTAKEAIKQVLLNDDVLLSSGEHCRSVGTSSDDKTILDFLSGVLSFQAEPNTKNSIEFTFRQEREKRLGLIWVCDLLFRGGDENSPSGNGIRFKMRNSDRRLIRQSLMCIGTG